MCSTYNSNNNNRTLISSQEVFDKNTQNIERNQKEIERNLII